MEPPKTRRSCLLRGLSLLLVAAITIAIVINEDRMDDIAALGYIGAFLAMLLSNATLILPAPGLVFVFALGGTLNPLGVGLFAAAGATLGEITGYMTGYSGLAVIDGNRLAERVRRWMSRNGSLTIFTLSIIPNPLFDFAGILAGLSHMSLWRFFGTAFFGKLIQSTSIALAGSLSLDWVQKLLEH
jgi:uncharacterized membrane protein YdjX (TVP38/TMEM64 family)